MNDDSMNKHENQKQKMIEAILNRDARILAKNQVQLTDEEKERFYKMVSLGTIGRADFSRIIEEIKGPSIESAFDTVEKSNFKKRILAYMSGLGFDNYEQVRPEIVEKFWVRYPNPENFESAKNDFLEAVRRSNTEQKYYEYLQEMKEFMSCLYGKKQEYAEVAEELKRDAEEWQLDQNAEQLKKDFLDNAIIEGDEWKQNGASFKLTTDLLEKAGLAPRFLLEVGGVEIALSKVFMVDVHETAIAYVKYNNQVYVRGYYRSNSQGMWRYLADYVGGDGTISWYGVGFNEESLNLPLKLQKILNQVEMRGLYEIPGVNTGFFLGGTAKRFESKEEYKKLVDDNKMEGAYYREVSREPKLNFGMLSALKHPPQSIDIDKGLAPNYRKQLDHYKMNTTLYGEVTVRQFPSLDDQLRFSVCEVGSGKKRKAWIGEIEANSTITSTGLKADWISTGDICTPLYEYQTMTNGYGEEIKGDRIGDRIARANGYESMWGKYLKNTPIIRRYLYTWREEI